MPCAARCTLREISCVVASAVRQLRRWRRDLGHARDGPPISCRTDRFPRRSLNAVDLLVVSPVAFAVARRALHFRRHTDPAPPRQRRFDGRVQRQQVGLPGDGVDEFDDVTDPPRLRQFAPRLLVFCAWSTASLAIAPILHLTADFVDDDAISSAAARSGRC